MGKYAHYRPLRYESAQFIFLVNYFFGNLTYYLTGGHQTIRGVGKDQSINQSIEIFSVAQIESITERPRKMIVGR